MATRINPVNRGLWSWQTLVIYLISKNSPAVSPWGWGERETRWVGSIYLWSLISGAPVAWCVAGADWAHHSWDAVCFSKCVKAVDASQPPQPPTLPYPPTNPTPTPWSHVLATRGWVSGLLLLQRWEKVKLYASSNKHGDRKNRSE